MTSKWVIVMFIFSLSDSIASGLISGHFIRRDNRTSTLFGLVAFSYFVRGIGELFGLGLGYNVEPRPTVGLVVAILTTRLLEMAILWLVYLHMIGVLNLNGLLDSIFLFQHRLFFRNLRKRRSQGAK